MGGRSVVGIARFSRDKATLKTRWITRADAYVRKYHPLPSRHCVHRKVGQRHIHEGRAARDVTVASIRRRVAERRHASFVSVVPGRRRRHARRRQRDVPCTHVYATSKLSTSSYAIRPVLSPFPLCCPWETSG